MSRKAIIILSAIVVFLVASVAIYIIGGSNLKSPKLRTIVVVLPSSSNPFWLEVRKGAEEARVDVPSYKIEIKVSTMPQDAKAQSDILIDLLPRNDIAAVVVGPASSTAPISALAKLDKKGIPSVIIDTTLNDKICRDSKYSPKAFVGSNNYSGAVKAAKSIFKELQRRKAKPPFRVLVLEGNRVHQSAIDRADGFYKAARELGMRFEGVRAEWSRAKAQDFTANKFAVGGFYNAIFACNDDMALGAITALKSLKIDTNRWPVIIGFDYTLPAIEAIEAGDMFGSVRQNPVKMGKMGVRLAALAASKDPGLPSQPIYLPTDVFPQQ